MEDQALIELYWARNEDAITETHRKYGPWCRGIALRILELQEDAEECVSDTYLQAWNNIPPQRPSVFRAWLGRITRNLALTRYRKNHAEKRGGGQTALALEELGDCVSGGPTVESEEERKEIAAAINRFLRSLPHPEQQVFLCRYWYLDPLAEICRQFSFSEGKVKSMLFRTRKKLRDFLSEEGYL